ncbi:hypothetical protein SAMN06265365_14827 [Tistlia consotensis]|uniref:Uncharacterized protein n=1 Tax=Tistlia consotensis USBA 355 TaxID=560819 RepID=A0A1Y6CWR5_9PROT|nr:hypothetical protein [Tistlia consotensis]SMF82961.1 hypothetical protein SAMN05428998_14828 [Tistlia consotensis USBA 355]SNS31555.1 hypothetical protein SAMN06265365_14827 [Tistlia consotensis]
MATWTIKAYGGDEPQWMRSFDEAEMSKEDIAGLLRCLAARHLTDDEVLDSLLPSKQAAHFELIPPGGKKFGLMTVGTGRHYVAMLELDGHEEG